MGLVLATLLFGCRGRELSPLVPCTSSEVGYGTEDVLLDTVDLLFVIDGASSMSEERALLQAEIPRLLRQLLAGDGDGDGATDFTPIRSLHVGVVSSDLGAGDVTDGEPLDQTALGCAPGYGDDALFRSSSLGPGCTATPRRMFGFERATDDPDRFAAELGCVSGLGACSFGQPLEAILKALSPASMAAWTSPEYVPPVFRGGSSGHGDGANAGFLRADSLLAIVLLTSEDDCSPRDEAIMHTTDLGVRPSLRCARSPGALQPVERYVQGLRLLRNDPAMLVFVPIVGVPEDLPAVHASCDSMRADPRMTVTEVTDLEGSSIAPSCHSEHSVASPPRRIMEVACGLEERGGYPAAVHSICAPSFAPAIDGLLERVGWSLGNSCLARSRDRGADGRVPCRLHMTLSPGQHCVDRGLPLAGIEEVNPRFGPIEVCLVPQLTPAVGAEGRGRGWYYDTESRLVRSMCGGNETAQRIAFSGMAPVLCPRLVCTETVEPQGAGPAQLGTFCTPFGRSPAEDPCPGSLGPSGDPSHPLSCDPLRHACGVACASEDDCEDAGLPGYVCDVRPLGEVVLEATRVPDVNRDGHVDLADRESPHGYCIHPSC